MTVSVELRLTRSLRMAEAEAATALLSSNENNTMLMIDLSLVTVVATTILNLPRQCYPTLERPRNTTCYMYYIRMRPID
jgi:hypothetical protein